MLRKLILLAVASGVAKALYARWSAPPDLPFPTSRRHPPRSE